MKMRFFPDLAAGFFLYIENPARSFVGAAGNRSFFQDPARMPVKRSIPGAFAKEMSAKRVSGDADIRCYFFFRLTPIGSGLKRRGSISFRSSDI